MRVPFKAVIVARLQDSSHALGALVVGALLLCSCGEDIPAGEKPFRCTTEACPGGSCKLVVEFAPDCLGQVQRAEVLLNGALEPGATASGKTFTSVGDTPKGEQAVFWVRSERWQWGPLTFTCKDPATDGSFTLSCKKADDGD